MPVREIRFYNQQGQRVGLEYDPEFAEGLQEIEECPEYCRYIDESLGVPSPKWFTASDTEARDFLWSLGFDSLKPTQLLAEDEELEEVGFDSEQVIALAQPLYNKLYVRREKIEAVRDTIGLTAVTAVLVHELAHDTAGSIETFAMQKKGEGIIPLFRNGFGVMGFRSQPRGMFFEEGFAHFIAGWYRHSKDTNYTSVVSIGETPTKTVPSHYLLQDERLTSGPDGYAIELLAWAAEKKCIMPASDFIATMLESRRPETRTAALRTFAQTIEAIKPGLYTYLRSLQYSKAAWQDGLAAVYDAVTVDGGHISKVGP